MALDFGNFLPEIRASSPHLALLLEQVRDAVNAIGERTGVDPTQHISPPDPPSMIQVKANAGNVHVVLTDNSQRSRPLEYFIEASTNPSFPDSSTHVEPMGPGRSKFFALPGASDGNVTQPWYFRSYSMYRGSSERSALQVYGGSSAPTPVTVGGSAQLTPLPMTGAGTTTQAGQGFGTNQYAKPQGGPQP